MCYRGKVHRGVIVLEPGVQLPEDQIVMVEPVSAHPGPTKSANWSGELRNGVPVFPPATDAPAPGLELVNRLRDETP